MTGIQHTSPSGDGLCSGRLFDVMPLRDSIVIGDFLWFLYVYYLLWVFLLSFSCLLFFVRTTDGNELAQAGVQNVNVGTAGRAPLFGSDYVSQSVPIIHHISVSTVDERGCVHTSPLITGSLEETSCSRAICSPGVAGYVGTPLPDVIDTIAETLVSTIPRALTEPEQMKRDTSTVAATIEPRASSAKRSLDKELSLEAKKKKGD
ncbi:hypothetical protein Tco_0924859 [Tanacetum coccineum]|uniref:Uncharacterized protein n=1 Tax=Tanacetum coccineum TaxID=301880 RepID=A0ABQ5D569_9ASTR